MYCSTCGTEIISGLNYCSRCGARVDKLAMVEKPSRALGVLSAATGFVGIGGLALTVGLIAILLNFAVKSEVVVMLALSFLATVFGMTFLMLRQISQMSHFSPPVKEKHFENLQLNQPSVAQLEEPRQPARSVTENTTRTLEKELAKIASEK